MKDKFHKEYILNRVSSDMLWQIISTPQGLSKWFADEVTSDGETFTFSWKGSSQKANMKHSCIGVYVRFYWEEETDPKAFFEMRISIDELTKDVILSVTDFAEPDELSDEEDLWNAQIENLKKTLGVNSSI